MSPAIDQKKIAIIGAGPVSLTLANILQNNAILFTLFEASDSFRTSGGSLDLHPESGQLALKESGLWEAFVKNSRPESDCIKVVNLDGEVLWDENLLKRTEQSEEEKFAGRPEIDRKLLMKILFENLNSENIVFGKKLDHITASSNDDVKHNLHFVDGTQQNDFDLVVGGDGAWSKVRNLLIDAKPQYSGITLLEVNCHNIQANPWLEGYVGVGSMFSFGEGRIVIAQRQGDGSLRTYAALHASEDLLDTCGINWEDESSAREQFVDQCFSDIGEDLKRLILDCKDDMWPRSLYELPVGFTWPHRAGVTLMGDAAHVMTPFAGVGVNVGMTDALVLAKEIVTVSKGEKNLDEAVLAYEKEMFPRAAKYAAKTAKGKKTHFSASGAQEFAELLKGRSQPA
ncbi:hypothetical protein GQ44DRAFT_707455 [Phaeosphaeriaceae sp. PMI808]|nr:hypothetical protein GQ44DRAFT_707455 [Phaeosphaeriaceae sp. PMI808]